jgi:hypothetical protein
MGKRTVNKQMAESIILAKLYKDGFILVNEKTKKVSVDMRKGEIVKHYKESSYEDVLSILERTVVGLKMADYKVKTRRIEGISPESEEKLDLIQTVLGESGIDDVPKN